MTTLFGVCLLKMVMVCVSNEPEIAVGIGRSDIAGIFYAMDCALVGYFKVT